MQKSKVKTEKHPAGRDYDDRKSLLGTSTFLGIFKSRVRGFALLTFAFCLLTFALALCLSPSAVNAQGCAMCYNSASAAKAGAKEALANGVLILLVPPMVFFALIAVVVYMYRNKYRDSSFVPGHLSFVSRSGDGEIWRLGEQGAEAPGFDLWSPDYPVVRLPDLLQGTKDKGRRTTDKQGLLP